MSDRTFTILRYAFFFALVLFGSFTLLSYLGVDQHLAVLLSDDAKTGMVRVCGDNTFCRQWYSLFPFVLHTVGRMSPFAWYLAWSVAAFALVLFRGFMRDGDWRLRLTFSPAKILVLFLASVWLFFSVVSLGDNGGADPIPNRRLFEATAAVYPGASAEELQALAANIDALDDRGCLKVVGQTNNGATVYDLSPLCMQASFVTRVLPQAAMVLATLFSMLVLGSVLLASVLKINARTKALELAFSLGLGVSAYTVLLWSLSLLAYWTGLPLYSTAVGWIIVLGIPAVFFRTSREWIIRARSDEWSYDAPWYAAALPIGWLLLSYLAFNFLCVIRPFPIGWDDLGRYLNQPHLLVSYGHFIPTMPTFQWEYVTSLGYLLFGYDSTFGATLSMLMNWMAGVFAILSIIVFGQAYLGKGRGVLAALVFYTLPMVGHFSFADMKIDNGLFAIGALAMLALFVALFPTADEEEKEAAWLPPEDAKRWIILAGVLAGIAFGMKPTAVMVIMTMGAILLGYAFGAFGFAGSALLSWFVYTQQYQFNVADVSRRVFGSADAMGRPLVLAVTFVAGGALLGYAVWKRRDKARPAGVLLGTFILSFFAAVLPWLAYNNASHGNVIPNVSFSVPNTYTPIFVIGKGVAIPDTDREVRALPDALRVDESHPACVSSARTEELDRYWGDHPGIGHYLTLPWRSVMNSDTAGYYITLIPALLLFPILLLLPFFWMKQGRWLRWTFAGTAFLLLQWVFFANGIPWYGIGMFLGLAIGLETLVARAPDRASSAAASVFIALSLFSSFAHRAWQYEQQKNLLEYPIGKISADALEERTIPHYDDIRTSIEERAALMPEQPYVYRIGTFIPYFIPKNLERIPVADQQLDYFNCLNQEKNPALTLQRLQALGFNGIVFDTNTQTIEKDPNGSLHQKVNAFADFANTPGLGLQIPVYDPDGGIAYILLPRKP